MNKKQLDDLDKQWDRDAQLGQYENDVPKLLEEMRLLVGALERIASGEHEDESAEAATKALVSVGWWEL